MPRPRICRRVWFLPNVTYFKPAGIRMTDLEENILTVDEFEAVRLKDLLGLEQEEAAKKMNISQPTFHRLVLSARKKIADALVSGKAIKIEGGNYKMPNSIGIGAGGIGRGFGRRAGGPPMVCVCPKCGYKIEHKIGTPCSTLKCPKCNISLTRG